MMKGKSLQPTTLQDGRVEDMCSSSPKRTPKLQLTAEPSSTGECWIPPKKDTPHPRAKEKPQQDGRRSKITIRIKTPYLLDTLRGLKKTLCTPGPRHPTEAEPDLNLNECLLWRSAVSCCCSRSSGCSRPGRHTLWCKSSWRKSISPTIESPSKRPTDWRILLPKKFLHYYRSSRTHNRFPKLGVWQRD